MSEKLNNNTSEFSKHETEHKSVEFGVPMTLRQFRETYPEDTTMCFADESYPRVMSEFRENFKNNPEEFEADIETEANKILEHYKKLYDVADDADISDGIRAKVKRMAEGSLVEKQLDKHQDEIMVFARPSLSDVMNNR